MNILNNNLFKRDSNGKVRHVILNLEEHIGDETYYSISGETGLYQGKMIARPLIVIKKGKVKRTIKEQAELQYDSLINSYLDKGYKKAEDLFITSIQNTEEVEEKVPKQTCDQNNNLKPMLALNIDDLPKSKLNVLDNKWLASKKIDGLRCLLFQKNGIIQTSSRGGKDYNTAAYYIINDPFVVHLFHLRPNYILDGELYIHGRPLNYISGLCRLKNISDLHKQLTFQCYDIVREDLPFIQRRNILDFIEHDRPLDSKLEIVHHSEVQGKSQMVELHNKYVDDGYEGLVIRDPNANYKCGARDERMMKIKKFCDDEFQITGITEGLREEDFVFNLITKEGYPFQAKPIGDKLLKKWYRDNINQIIGKMATVKYFGYTNTSKPVPNLPVLKCLRDKFDM